MGEGDYSILQMLISFLMGMLGLIKTQRESHSDTDLAEGKNKFVCKVCKSVISEEAYLLIINSSTPYHTFTNPHGHTFHLVLFSHCESILPASPPSSEYTWFPGYTWTILCCTTCYEHLGWRFEGSNKMPSRFYGMIRNRLEIQEG